MGLSSAGVAFGGGFRHFVVDALAPGVEGAVYRVGGVTYGYTFGSLRVVPLRFEKFALVLTGRAGRVYLSEHSDGWAYGGDAGVRVPAEQTRRAGAGLGGAEAGPRQLLRGPRRLRPAAPGDWCAGRVLESAH